MRFLVLAPAKRDVMKKILRLKETTASDIGLAYAL